MVHWYWTDSPVGSKDGVVASIEEIFVISTDMSSPTFDILQLSFACVCYHYNHLNARIHKTTACEHRQLLLLLVKKKTLKSLLLKNIPGQA